MLAFYEDFVTRYDLPDEAVACLLDAGRALIGRDDGRFSAILDAYRAADYVIEGTLDARKALADESGIPLYTVNFVVLVATAYGIRDAYRAKGLSDELFYETMRDILYKVYECHDVYGVWGVFVEFWYTDFFRLRLFKLGRLEYQLATVPEGITLTMDGETFRPGDPILSVHIPSCGPLTRAAREESFRRAYDFFPELRRGTLLPCICCSWLLYEKNPEIFPARLNIMDFFRDWLILKSGEQKTDADAWRLFSRDLDGHPEALPRETTQQRAMADWLMKGGHFGWGWGFLAVDGKTGKTRKDFTVG